MPESNNNKALGFRVERDAIHWSVVGGNVDEPILIDSGKYAAPGGYAEPEALTWYRSRVDNLIDVHKPTHVGLKLMEPKARSSAKAALQARQHIEGVLLQLADERKLTVFSGALTSVAAKLDTKTPKDYLERKDLRGIDWSKKNKHVKEAILAATAALNA